jgi:hypothetical protein
MRTLLFLLAAAPLLAQTPLSCPEAAQVKCERTRGGDFGCFPGIYERVPMDRPILEERSSDASIRFDDGKTQRLKEVVFDTRGLSRLEQNYVMEEYHRAKGGGRRTELTTKDRRTGDVTVRVSVPSIAVRRFREWMKGGCQPPGAFLRYQLRGQAGGGGGKVVISERDRNFRDRLLGNSSPDKWAPGGAMDRRSREIRKGRGRR